MSEKMLKIYVENLGPVFEPTILMFGILYVLWFLKVKTQIDVHRQPKMMFTHTHSDVLNVSNAHSLVPLQ